VGIGTQHRNGNAAQKSKPSRGDDYATHGTIHKILTPADGWKKQGQRFVPPATWIKPDEVFNLTKF
jgi:hypothetical protein